MNRFQNFMMGRYGVDALQYFIIAVYIILSIVNMLVALPILVAISYVLILVWAFRFFSRNIYKREAENRKFKEITKPIHGIFFFWQRRFKERHINRIYKCPNCHQTIRVPKGKGKIAITCPKCRHEFIKRT